MGLAGRVCVHEHRGIAGAKRGDVDIERECDGLAGGEVVRRQRAGHGAGATGVDRVDLERPASRVEQPDLDPAIGAIAVFGSMDIDFRRLDDEARGVAIAGSAGKSQCSAKERVERNPATVMRAHGMSRSVAA